mmetsp:Transcript_27119/g.48662  ORF Transcript_27119/g.48662 Transcript_27119/m.48662 type:complete len:283 (+) Transcript_27119:1503-2351(+)
MIVVKAGEGQVLVPAKDLRLSRLVSYAAERKFKFGMFKIYWVRSDSTQDLITNQDSLSKFLEGPLPQEIVIKSCEDEKNERKGPSLFDRLKNSTLMSQAQSAIAARSIAHIEEEPVIHPLNEANRESELPLACKDSRATSAETVMPRFNSANSLALKFDEKPADASLSMAKMSSVSWVPSSSSPRDLEYAIYDRNQSLGKETTIQLSITQPKQLQENPTPSQDQYKESKRSILPLPLHMLEQSQGGHHKFSSAGSTPMNGEFEEIHPREQPAKKRKRCCLLL